MKNEQLTMNNLLKDIKEESYMFIPEKKSNDSWVTKGLIAIFEVIDEHRQTKKRNAQSMKRNLKLIAS